MVQRTHAAMTTTLPPHRLFVSKKLRLLVSKEMDLRRRSVMAVLSLSDATIPADR